MIPILVGGATGFLFTFLYFLGTDYDYPQRIGRIEKNGVPYTLCCLFMWAIIGAFVGFCASIVIGVTAVNNNEYHCTVDRRTELVALTDSHSTNGSFFLGTGFVNSQLTYFFFTKTGDVIHSGSLEAGSVNLIEDSPERPYRVDYTSHFNPGWDRYVIIDNPVECPVDFHIPPDSVERNYKVG